MEVDDVHEIARFDSELEENSKELSQLQSDNLSLRNNVADLSYKLAMLFNASYEYGGAKLLDYLQVAIGLT